MIECLFFYVFAVFIIGAAQARDFQLPKNAKPIEYDLTIIPDLHEGTYLGKVLVTVNITKRTHSLTLHGKNLEITGAKINTVNAKISTNINYDFIILRTDTIIDEGNHTVSVGFRGDMKNKTYGFFRGYEEENGEVIYFGATFFEPTNARVAFPCFDEPIFKAQFSLRIAKPPGYIALSNMNELFQTPGPNGSTFVHFAKTPVMSSYLVSFFVGKYAYVEDYHLKQNNEVVPVRIYSPPTKIANARFAVHQMPKLLTWFSNYTGFDYMLPKLDYITFNSNFHIVGGMEDWGAISSQEDSIFYNGNMSELAMDNVFNVAHEFGHIWFGDLLTTSSWTEFWLNEGFARYMDIKVNEIYEDRELSLENPMSVLKSALWRDDDLTVKPLAWEMKNAIDAYQLLNTINYDKGGSVLLMVEDLIGSELMRKVMQTYVQSYQYQNVVSQNFIDVLQKFISINATDFMGGFVRQSGYPVIIVKRLKSKRHIVLTMKRFLRFSQVDKKTRWSVPIKYITDLTDQHQLIWFNRSQDRVVLEFPTDVAWVKLNFQRGGYYRANYPPEMWMYFGRIMKTFSIRDRINLLDDSMALVRSGQLECSVALNIMNYLYDEEQFEAWTTAQHSFGIIRKGLLQHNFTLLYFLSYITKLVDKQYKKSKWIVDDYETIRTKRTRNTIFNLACFYGHKDCRKKVKELWDIQHTLPIDLRNIVLTNNPRKVTDYNASSQNGMEMQSDWFGADLSLLPVEQPFKWPRKLIENCNEWLKKKIEI